ncbi:hypothetical protein ACNOYE_25745 [Nannocystaceae bacterium ST9]
MNWPALGDDFDWQLRDFESFRRFMLEELAARFPQRKRWTAADVEVVIVEALANQLDQLSDMADRVVAERVLETARRPESVRRLLAFIGYDAAREAGFLPAEPVTEQVELECITKLEQTWLREPEQMEIARRAGPRNIHAPQRMVSLADYGELLERHPLVYRARARRAWSGSWTRVSIAVLAHQEARVDRAVTTKAEQSGDLEIDLPLAARVEEFHLRLGLRRPAWVSRPTIRRLLECYIDANRMIGHEVELCDPVYVPLDLRVRMRIDPRYFRSELRGATRVALGTQVGGFFARGRLEFGEDVHASDVIQVLMALEGVESVMIERFKRLGARFRDQAIAGVIRLEDLEIAVCDDDPERPQFGRIELVVEGGRTG